MKYLLPLAALLLFLAASPKSASAHERRVYHIGTADYTFVLGFLNEPVSVDDKTGLELAVSLGNGAPTRGPDGDMDGPAANTTPLLGLEKDLKVEVSAGTEKKVLTLAPAWGMPGHYNAVLYPSMETTYAFRIFGTLNKVPVDLSFTCNASGQAPETDSKAVKISDGVSQTSKSGAFSCPTSRTDVTFPTPAVTLSGVDQKVQNLEGISAKAMVGIVLGVLGLITGLGAWRRRG